MMHPLAGGGNASSGAKTILIVAAFLLGRDGGTPPVSRLCRWSELGKRNLFPNIIVILRVLINLWHREYCYLTAKHRSKHTSRAALPVSVRGLCGVWFIVLRLPWRRK